MTKARRKISQALRENTCGTRKSSDNSSTRTLDSSKAAQNDDLKRQHISGRNSIHLNAYPQSIDASNSKSMEVSLLELELLLQDFLPPVESRGASHVTGQGSSTVEIDNMPLSIGSYSTHMESYSAY